MNLDQLSEMFGPHAGAKLVGVEAQDDGFVAVVFEHEDRSESRIVFSDDRYWHELKSRRVLLG